MNKRTTPQASHQPGAISSHPDAPVLPAITEADHEKQAIALSSVMAAVLLTGMKLGIGLWTNSLGILSEAAHSGLDFLAAAMTFYAVRFSAKPADGNHSYGHGKIENLSALFETLLLLVTCAWIIYEACHRLFFEPTIEVIPNAWAFLVVIVSIIVDISRSRALLSVAKKHKSQALEADALHFSTDIWSSCVVLLGLIGVLLSRLLNLPWLLLADSVAALGVAVIVIGISLKLGKKSIDDLLDAFPSNQGDVITRDLLKMKGIQEVKQVRIRRSGPQVFADITVTLDPRTSLTKAHDRTLEIERLVQHRFPAADVMVHVEPSDNKEHEGAE